MKRNALAVELVLALALACGGGDAGPPAARFEGGGLAVEVRTSPVSPRAGANRLALRVSDAAGEPVSDAEIDVSVRMDMAGMAPMAGRTRATPQSDGRYEAELSLDMAGSWQIAIEAKRAGRPMARARGTITTGTPGLRLDAEPAAEPAAADSAPGAAHDPGAHAHAETAEGGAEIAHWTCPMHPSVRANEPGVCPICGMTLVPVTRQETRSADVRIDDERRRQVGIRSAPVARGTLERVIRASGRVVPDETTLVDVSLKVRGWIETLHANALGAKVTKGEPLFTLYSPELYSAQAELLQALRSQGAARGTTGSGRTDALARAARTRLRLWDVPEAEIGALVRRGTPSETISFRAPVSGTIVEKDVTQGAAVEPGMRLLRIAPLGRVWIEAQLAEAEQGLVQVGQRVVVRLPFEPGVARDATVAWVSPTLDAETRTLRVRLVLPNDDGALRPDAFAEVELRIPLGERLLVPASAVLYAGPRRVVFVDLGDGRLRPTDVVLGQGNRDSFEVLSGLEEGQQVVVSGNFLVAAESRLKSALEGW